MRLDYLSNLNSQLHASVKHMREALALKQAEVARLESLIRVTENMASEEQMPGDPTVNGDREPLPSVLQPKTEDLSGSAEGDGERVIVNGRPLVAPRQAAA